MKMLTTQLTGLFNKIATEESFAIEETARLLAQATVSDGRIIIATSGEMDVVTSRALHGDETLRNVVPYTPHLSIEPTDRVLIVTTSADDRDALTLARTLHEQFVPFAAIAPPTADVDNALADVSYTYVATHVHRGLLPTEEMTRTVFPHSIATLYIFEAIRLAYEEMLRDD